MNEVKLNVIKRGLITCTQLRQPPAGAHESSRQSSGRKSATRDAHLPGFFGPKTSGRTVPDRRFIEAWRWHCDSNRCRPAADFQRKFQTGCSQSVFKPSDSRDRKLSLAASPCGRTQCAERVRHWRGAERVSAAGLKRAAGLTAASIRRRRGRSPPSRRHCHPRRADCRVGRAYPPDACACRHRSRASRLAAGTHLPTCDRP